MKTLSKNQIRKATEVITPATRTKGGMYSITIGNVSRTLNDDSVSTFDRYEDGKYKGTDYESPCNLQEFIELVNKYIQEGKF